MHIPYSMDDSQPDLYGGYGGHADMVEQVAIDVGYVALDLIYTQADMDAAVAKAYQDGYDNALRWS